MPSESSLLCTFSEDQQKIIEKRTAQRGKAPGRLHAFGAHNPSYQSNFENFQNVRKRRMLLYAYGKSLRLAECLIKSNELNEWVLSDTLVYDSVYYGIPVWCPHRTRRRSQTVSRPQRNVYRKKTDVIQNSSIGDPRQQMLLHRRVLIISNCRKGAHTHEGRQLVYSRCIPAKVDDFHCSLKKRLAIRSADCEIESHKLAQGVPKVFHLVYYPDDWHKDHP